MKKYRLVKTIENTSLETGLWFNNQTSEYELWRNHKKVGSLHKAEAEKFTQESNEFDVEEMLVKTYTNFVKKLDKENLTLNEYLYWNNIKLTKLEVECLNEIFAEGSFYEEAANYTEDNKPYADRKYGTFIGWEIMEWEVKGCRGALSSLKKKGILTIVSENINDEDCSAYYIHFTPEFKEDGSYHELKIDEDNLK